MDDVSPGSVLFVGKGSGSMLDRRKESSLTLLFLTSLAMWWRSSLFVPESGSGSVSFSDSEYRGIFGEYGIVSVWAWRC